MSTTKYELKNPKENETPAQTVIRCANNLIKAVLAAGYSIHKTSGVSGIDINFYNHHPGDIVITNILAGWQLEGRHSLNMTFKAEEPSGDLTEVAE